MYILYMFASGTFFYQDLNIIVKTDLILGCAKPLQVPYTVATTDLSKKTINLKNHAENDL